MQDSRDKIAERMLRSGALRTAPGTEEPLVWDDAAALADAELREELCGALAELIRDHYAAADAVLGGAWAKRTAELLGLPYRPEQAPERPVLIAPLIGEAEAALKELLLPVKRKGGSPAAAVLYQNGNEKARAAMDRADVRCHWLTDLEAAAGEALRSGLLDFEDYCVLLPQ